MMSGVTTPEDDDLYRAVQEHDVPNIDRLIARGVWSLRAYNLALICSRLQIASAIRANHPEMTAHRFARARIRPSIDMNTGSPVSSWQRHSNTKSLCVSKSALMSEPKLKINWGPLRSNAELPAGTHYMTFPQSC